MNTGPGEKMEEKEMAEDEERVREKKEEEEETEERREVRRRDGGEGKGRRQREEGVREAMGQSGQESLSRPMRKRAHSTLS